jgi:hypothetical protein
MSFLFGSAPQAQFSTQPTTQPGQQDLFTVLSQLLSGTPGTIQPAQGTFAAPVTGPQQQLLALLQGTSGQASGANLPGAETAVTGALNALPAAQSFQAPQIDPSAAFQSGVVQPLTQNFNENVLPAIAGQFGASAGGATNTGSLMARETAGQQLDTTLADTGAQYALGAAQSNQSADLAANQQRLAALGLASPLATTSATLPGTTAASNANPLIAILQALGLPQSTQQTQISGSYNTGQMSIADLIASALQPTQQTNAVGTGGSTGLLQSLLSGLAGNAGIGNAISQLLAPAAAVAGA